MISDDILAKLNLTWLKIVPHFVLLLIITITEPIVEDKL